MSVDIYICGKKWGKSEIMRKKLGLSHEEYENLIKKRQQEIEDIFPENNPGNKEYLIDITNKISRFVFEQYEDVFDPTIIYSENKINIWFDLRKNASVGACLRIPRVIRYGENKIVAMRYSELIWLAAHECAHLVYDGHDKNFIKTRDFIFDKCLLSLKQHNRERDTTGEKS